MKNIISSVFLLLFTIAIQAQEVNEISIKEIPAKYITVELRPVFLGMNFGVIDYGQIKKYTAGGNLKRLAGIKENNELKEFKSDIEILNYLADLGFKFIESYQNISSNLDDGVNTSSRKYLLENLNR